MSTTPRNRFAVSQGPRTSGMRSAVVWGIRYGLPGAAIRYAARRGDLTARSAVDPTAGDDPAGFYAELRAMGPIGGNKLISASAQHAVVNQILRSDAFRANPGGAERRLLQIHGRRHRGHRHL